MSSLEELLKEQTKIITMIIQVIPTFEELEPAKWTSVFTRNRIAKLKDLFSECRELDAKIVSYADAGIKESHTYFVDKHFKKAEEWYEKALDFMSEILEKNSPSTSTGSSATTSYHKQQNVDDTTKSIIKDGSKQDVSDKQHKTMNSAERLSMNAIGKQSCQTSTQTIHEANTQQVQDSASDDSLKRQETNRDITNTNQDKKYRFDGFFIERADFVSDVAWFRFKMAMHQKQKEIKDLRKQNKKLT